MKYAKGKLEMHAQFVSENIKGGNNLKELA